MNIDDIKFIIFEMKCDSEKNCSDFNFNDKNHLQYLINELKTQGYAKRHIKRIIETLTEGFKTIDPRTGELKIFFKPENYKLALRGKHPDYIGVFFKKYEEEEEEDKKSSEKHINFTQEQMMQIKKSRLNAFIRILRKFAKLNNEKRAKVINSIIEKFRIEKDSTNKRLYVYGTTTKFKDKLGVSGAKIIKAFENAGGLIPVIQNTEI